MDDMITAKVDEGCSTLERNIICLENKIDTLQEALQSLTERGVQLGESTVSSGTVPSITVPKAVSYKDKKLEIAILLLKQVEGLSEPDKEAIIENLNRSALSICRAFASQNHMGHSIRYLLEEIRHTGWGSLNGTEQWTMLKSMQEEVVEIDPRFGFLKYCACLWPCEFILQPKWTQMSKNFRTERQNAEAKKIIGEYHYQMTPYIKIIFLVIQFL
ncbi:uncharacterized protein EV154DRAFT_582272 [Mucor mucedo]|uniref:uncharacterized protein n=1 Tax=Mucor mucedo TaxID=29922 RepID=UPI002220EE19|nr:uncharacterized protein EV154DRAFT_582272 [Mucor mucedo]KAI7868053.1 hypothetical protein EV154DRAFT_582272 [Mucor mucedo]